MITMLLIGATLTFVYLFVWNRKRLNAKWWECIIISIVYTFIGGICARFWALMEAGFNVKEAGNISLFGTIFLAPIFFLIHAIIKKIPFKTIFDVMLIPMVIGLFCSRCNCLRAGCCIGILTSGGNRVPTKGIEIGYYLIYIAISFVWLRSNKSNGLIYPTFLLSYGTLRFIIEWFRESDSTTILHMGHIWSIVSMVIGIGSLLTIVLLSKKQANKKYEMNEGAAV